MPEPLLGAQWTSVALGSGSLYAAGFIDGFNEVDFGDGATAGTNGQTSSLLVKFDADRRPLWTRTQTSADSAQFNAVAASGSAVYAVGAVSGNASWGPDVETPGTLLRAVIVKYDSDGNVVWARCPTATDGTRSQFNAVAVDTDGNVYAAGSYRFPVLAAGGASIGFGGGVTLTASSRSSNLLLVKYSAQGEALWARTQTDSADNPNPEFAFRSIAVDQDSVYAAGTIEARSAIDLGGGVTVQGNGTFYGNGVLVKYSADGEALWARTQTSGSHSAEYTSVAVDGTEVYVGGDVYDAPVGFGDGVSLPGTGGNNAAVFVLVKYDSAGKALWARHPTANHGSSSVQAVDVGNGGIYGAGWTGSDAVDLGTGVAVGGLNVPANPGNLLLVRYDADGTPREVHAVSGSDGASFYTSLVVDPVENAAVAAGGAGQGPLDPQGGLVVNRGTGSAKGPVLVRY